MVFPLLITPASNETKTRTPIRNWEELLFWESDILKKEPIKFEPKMTTKATSSIFTKGSMPNKVNILSLL